MALALIVLVAWLVWMDPTNRQITTFITMHENVLLVQAASFSPQLWSTWYYLYSRNDQRTSGSDPHGGAPVDSHNSLTILTILPVSHATTGTQ